MQKTKAKKITICSSASFYKEVWEIAGQLRKLGFKTAVPLTVYTMKKNKNFDVSLYKPWHKDSSAYKRKTYLMKHHFKKVIESDSVLIVNLEKNGKKGYIGGNGLMEMAIAFHYRKPIFIWEEISSDSPFYEEILGMSPIFIKRDLHEIR